MKDWHNILISFGSTDDLAFQKAGHKLIGGARDSEGKECHVWLKKGRKLRTRGKL